MMRRLLMLFALLAFVARAFAQDFLEPEAAFRFAARMADGGTAEVSFDIADGYYMYRDRFKFSADGAKLGAPELPAGKVKFDQTFGKQVETYRHRVTVRVPVQGEGPFVLRVTSQGCADAGLCYSPMESGITMQAAAPLAQVLQGGRLLKIVPLFLLLGLGLAFTPCVLPMVPILSSIIVGDSAKPSRKRGLLLSAAYSLGMALVYTAFGIAAGLAGEGLAASLQKPWVIGGFALLLTALALSMFGLYELQLPNALQSRLAESSNRRSAGKLAGVFGMGAISALMVGPCVAAPLAGALVYISQTRDVLVGGSALFAMAAGMSVPLVLVGVSAGSLLPRAGAWMVWVKRGFGVMLLALAAWMALPLLPSHHTSALPFKRISNVQELEAELAKGKPVMLDFYADWCVSCKEMEKFTFSAAPVKAALQGAVLLQADVTANTEQDKALLKRFGLFGPPAIILFGGGGKEGARVIGYQDAERFQQTLAKIR
ncbi:protein-disulfide reductase DsbD [Pseudoduganella eburnea]|uniref:Protein-disulfide reductase DsbD n=1 Tax=Massilia eburnea TaxID=1776165 RepID=A0A6L6QNG6_9BURK|nr:protein-disulfide reductase DsbD [Massilia eburnea]MTW13909.1 protein-disulfide reductase DsbD [Massilia eburnea]